MSSISLIIMLIAVVPAFSLAAWVWLSVIYADDGLLTFSNIFITQNKQGFYD